MLHGVLLVGDILAVRGENARCGLFGRDLDQMTPVDKLRDLRRYLSGCSSDRDRQTGVLHVFQQSFAEPLAYEKRVWLGKSVPIQVGTILF